MKKILSSISENEWQVVALSLISTLVLLALVAKNSLILGTVTEWSWGKTNVIFGSGIFWFLALSILFLVFCYFALNAKIRLKPLIIAGAIIFYLSFSLLIFSLDNHGEGFSYLSRLVRHPGVTSYYNDAEHITEVTTFLKTYTQNIPSFGMHSQTHPPGPILFFYYIKTAAEHILPNFNPATVAGFAIVLMSSLTILPLYFFVRLISSEKAAVISILLYSIVPSVVLFTPEFDQVYPLFLMLILLTYLLGMKSKNYLYFLLSGLILAVSLFFSFLYISVPIMLLILCGALYPLRSSIAPVFYRLKNFVFSNLILIAGFILPNLIYALLFKSNIYSIYQGTMTFHQKFLATTTYQTWVFFNLYDFAIFLGVPLALILIFALGKEIFNWINRRGADVAFWLFALTILILDLTGKNRGEVARIWIFLVPLAVAAVASYITKSKNPRFLFLFVIAIVLLQLIVFKKFVLTLGL